MVDRRQEPRREDDRVLNYRVDALEENVKTFAPIAMQVALLQHDQSDIQKRQEVADKRMDSFEQRLEGAVTRIEGMSVKLALIVGTAAVVGGGLVTFVANLLAHH